MCAARGGLSPRSAGRRADGPVDQPQHPAAGPAAGGRNAGRPGDVESRNSTGRSSGRWPMGRAGSAICCNCRRSRASATTRRNWSACWSAPNWPSRRCARTAAPSPRRSASIAVAARRLMQTEKADRAGWRRQPPPGDAGAGHGARSGRAGPDDGRCRSVDELVRHSSARDHRHRRSQAARGADRLDREPAAAAAGCRRVVNAHGFPARKSCLYSSSHRFVSVL